MQRRLTPEAAALVDPTGLGAMALGDAGLRYDESLELLARRAGVVLPYEKPYSVDPGLYRLRELVETVVEFYETYLWRSPAGGEARAYLERRQLDQTTCRTFRLGLAPAEPSGVTRRLLRAGWSIEEAAAAGICHSNGSDVFPGRLMFPVADRTGRVLGFGGRNLTDDAPGGKYINSPNGPLYAKGCTLYAGPDVRQACRVAGYVIVVEGYVDVLALWRRGTRNVAGVMGTAFARAQAAELEQLADVAVLAFDPDSSGALAAQVAEAKHAVRTTCVHLPDGFDPADLMDTDEGYAAWNAAVEQALNA